MPSSFAPVAERVRRDGERFRDIAQTELYQQELQARHLFPMRSSQAHLDLAPSVAWLLERSSPATGMSDEVRARMRQLALDHRRHGFPAETYAVFAQALATAVRGVTEGVDKHLVNAAATLLGDVCTLMAETTQEADLAGIAPAWVGEVTSVRKASRRISVVTLESGQPFSYLPGQSLPVSTNYLPGTWRLFTPATPSSDYGVLELHIRGVDEGKASPFLTNPRPGDLWSCGTGRGEVSLPAEECIVVAFGTGWAAAKALLLEQIHQDRPPVHLLLVAEYPAEIYDWEVADTLRQHLPWLSITALSFHERDPWWLKADGPRPHTEVVASVPDLVATHLRPQQVRGRKILLLGSAVLVDEAIVALGQAGIPWMDVDMLRFEHGPRWAPPR